MKDTENSNLVTRKYSFQIGDISAADLDVSDFQVSVIEQLSVKKAVRFPGHQVPQVRQAVRIENSSLQSTLVSLNAGGQDD